MANSNGAFTLTINTNAGFGETTKPHIENYAIRRALLKVAQQVGSGVASSAILDDNGVSIGSYTWGAGMSNAGR